MKKVIVFKALDGGKNCWAWCTITEECFGFEEVRYTSPDGLEQYHPKLSDVEILTFLFEVESIEMPEWLESETEAELASTPLDNP